MFFKSPSYLCAHTCLSSRASTSCVVIRTDRKSTRLNSSHSQISYAVFCLKKKKTIINAHDDHLAVTLAAADDRIFNAVNADVFAQRIARADQVVDDIHTHDSDCQGVIVLN